MSETGVDSQRCVTSEQIRRSFRRVDKHNYPELASYSWDAVYGHGDQLAPGGLYLASRMTQNLGLCKGDVVLDLACGRGDTSIFLAEHFGVNVVAVDLWIPADVRAAKFDGRGYRTRIVPLRLDITRGLPFAEDYFDAIFCMQAFHSFGGSVAFLRHLLSYLKPGGRLTIGGTCLNEEPPHGRLPAIYARTDGWDAEYAKYHSPPWWKNLMEASGLLDVIHCDELAEGRILWEDEVLYGGERSGWSASYLRNGQWLIDQIIFGRDHRPYLTHFMATAQKREYVNSTATMQRSHGQSASAGRVTRCSSDLAPEQHRTADVHKGGPP